MSLFWRYLAGAFFPPFLISALFFVIFLLTFQLFRITSIVVNKGVEFITILQLTGHIAITFLPLAIPISVLFATMYSLNRLSEDSEIVAMRSFGVKKWQLFAPFLICGLLIAGMIFSLNRNIIPYSKRQFKNTIIKMTSKGMINDINPEVFFTEIPGITLFAEKVLKGGNKLSNVFIHMDPKRFGEEKVIVAKEGSLVKILENKGESPNIRLYLKEGNIARVSDGKKRVEKILFYEYDFPLFQGGYQPGFVTKDSMRSLESLLKVINIENRQLLNLKNVKSLTLREKDELRNLNAKLVRSKLEYWSRFNTPLQVLVFVLLGFALGIKTGRGRSRNSGATALIVLVAYFTLFFFGVSIARKGGIEPIISVFFPTVLVAILGINMYKKLDWTG